MFAEGMFTKFRLSGSSCNEKDILLLAEDRNNKSIKSENTLATMSICHCGIYDLMTDQCMQYDRKLEQHYTLALIIV